MTDLLFQKRVQIFKKQFPSLDSQITGLQAYRWHTLLTKSCIEGRKKFFRDNEIKFDETYTLKEFFDLTRNSYNDKIIKYVEKLYQV